MGDCIYLEQNKTDSIGFQVSELAKITEKLKSGSESIKIDLKNVSFLNPTIILGISSLLFMYRKKGVNCELISVSPELQKYLNTIKFPQGIFPALEGDWDSILDSYSGKNYLPIINFPSDNLNDNAVIRDAVLSKVSKIIAGRLNLLEINFGALNYFITEFTQNIVEHANVLNGRILVQFYPVKEYIEICIIDEGKTILGSYRDNKQFDILNDKDAIKAALGGNSTKSPERGFGLYTSSRIIIEAMKGKLCVVSGTGMLVNTTVISYQSTWNGTLLSIKIPMNMEKINIYDFIS